MREIKFLDGHVSGHLQADARAKRYFALDHYQLDELKINLKYRSWEQEVYWI
jgi:hypothetical protein